MRARHAFIFILIFSLAQTVHADVMSSANYKIFSDVISVGGVNSTSTNYQVIDVLGEQGTGPASSTSSNFQLLGGFLAMSSSSVVSASLSVNSINLGTLTSTAVSSASQVLSVTTNALNGYSATIQTDGPLRSGSNTIQQVGGGQVSAGTEGYGIRTSGADALMNSSDTAINTSAQAVARSLIPIISDQTTVTYKASISSLTPAGSYSQTVTFTTTANF